MRLGQVLPPAAPAHRRRWALLVWALWAALLLGLVVLVLASPFRVPETPSTLLDLWLFHVVMALACALTALRAVLLRGQGLAWSLLAAGMASWLVGDLYWFFRIEPLGDAAPYPSLADALYLAFYPCAAAALLLLAGRQPGATRGALHLDGLVAGLGAAAAAALTFDALTGEGDTAIAVLVNLAYPVVDLVLLGLTLAALAAQGWRLTARWSLLAAGSLAFLAADANYLLGQADDSYTQGSPWDLGWVFAFCLIAAAGWQRAPAAPSSARVPAVLVPTVVTAMSVGLLVAATSRHVPDLAVGLAAAALAVAAVRIGLAFSELRSLVESRRLSLTDELTGLGNRRLLHDRLGALLVDRSPGDVLAVLLLDLDRFKEVNDALGHHVGDELLRRIGPRLSGALRSGDLLIRLGGDEFAILLGPGSDAEYAVAVAQRVRESLRAPFQLDDVELHLSVSIGIALCPDHALTASALLQCADAAMYDAKRARSGHAVYAPTQDRHDRSRLETIAQLHAAIADGQLVCHYQPQCSLASGEIVGAEALVRWEHPERGVLEPSAFLGLVSQVGLMPDLTRQVLARAVADCQSWRRTGVDLSVSVNLSGHSLSDSTLPQDVARLLKQHRLPASALQLEVTEDVLVVDASTARDVVSRLQALGVRLSIDDYGTGYSSLTQLRTLPVDELKLDRSYIAGLGSDDRDAAIVRSTVALAHALGLTVVAEGVETQDDWQELVRLRCDRAQGFLLSPPLAPQRLLSWLDERRAAPAAERIA